MPKILNYSTKWPDYPASRRDMRCPRKIAPEKTERKKENEKWEKEGIFLLLVVVVISIIIIIIIALIYDYQIEMEQMLRRQ